MAHNKTRTPQESAAQKARTERNRAKPRKPIKGASEKTKARKLAEKETKRERFIRRSN